MADDRYKRITGQRKNPIRKEIPEKHIESRHFPGNLEADEGKFQTGTAILRDVLCRYIADNAQDERSSIDLLHALLNLESEQKINAYLFSLLNSLKNA
jgi:hypothetical protein